MLTRRPAITSQSQLGKAICARINRPYLQTDIRRLRKTTRTEHNDPTDARTKSARLFHHRIAYIY